MPAAIRSRRTQAQLETEVRRMLRETVVAESFWTAADILDAMNRCIDFRMLEMAEEGENWFVSQYVTNIVANQREYELPSNGGRPRRIALRYTSGSQVAELDLWRNERIGEDYHSASGSIGTWLGGRPTARLLENLLLLEPPPTQAVTQGLLIEIEVAPPRLALTTDTIPDPFPDLFETLLIFDTWDELIGVEDAQGNTNPEQMGRLQKKHRKVERAWQNYISVRMDSRVLGKAFSLGD